MEPLSSAPTPVSPSLEPLLRGSPGVLYAMELGEAGPRPVFLAPNLPDRLGWDPTEGLNDPGWWLGCVHQRRSGYAVP